MAQWNAKQLITAIDSNEILDRDHVWVGVYNAPWQNFGRYNEGAFTSEAHEDGQWTMNTMRALSTQAQNKHIYL